MSQRARATASQTPAGGPWATARIGSRAAGTPKMRAPASAPSCAQRDRFALCLRVWSRARRAPRASATRLNREKYRACTSVNAFVPLATAVRGVEPLRSSPCAAVAKHWLAMRGATWRTLLSVCGRRAMVPGLAVRAAAGGRAAWLPPTANGAMPGPRSSWRWTLWYKFFWKLT